MAYALGSKCAKNLCKRIVLLQLIIEDVVACFFEHTVDALSVLCAQLLTRDLLAIAKFLFRHSDIENGTENNGFYRATRMHSADYAVARCPSVCSSVCPSVCPSVTRRY